MSDTIGLVCIVTHVCMIVTCTNHIDVVLVINATILTIAIVNQLTYRGSQSVITQQDDPTVTTP